MADRLATSIPVLLLVEDDAEQRMMLREFFSDILPCDLREAEDARSALTLARSRRPNLVLLDLHIPPEGGLHLLRHMHEDPHLSAVPVIAMSGARIAAEREAAEAAGAYCFIEKPYDLDLLEAAVCNALAGKPPPKSA